MSPAPGHMVGFQTSNGQPSVGVVEATRGRTAVQSRTTHRTTRRTGMAVRQPRSSTARSWRDLRFGVRHDEFEKFGMDCVTILWVVCSLFKTEQWTLLQVRR